MRINGGYFVFRHEILDDDRARARSSSSEPFAATDRAARAARVSRTTGSGSRWTRSRTSRSSTRSLEGGRAPWRRAATCPDPDARPLARGVDWPVQRVLAIGCHADDIEIGCGGDAARARRGRAPELAVTWVVLAAPGERADEARASAAAFLARADARTSGSTTFRDGFLPYVGGEVKDVFEGLKERRARPRLHAHAQRSPPGPPPRLRADLEHVPRPPHPRVRGAEVRRRPRLSERLRPARRGARRARSFGCSRDHYASQRGKHWFDDELFRGLMRIRGMESATRYAEAFTCRKLSLSLA